MCPERKTPSPMPTQLSKEVTINFVVREMWVQILALLTV